LPPCFSFLISGEREAGEEHRASYISCLLPMSDACQGVPFDQRLDNRVAQFQHLRVSWLTGVVKKLALLRRKNSGPAPGR